MKYTITFLLVICCSFITKAQKQNPVPVFSNSQNLPPFKIILAPDSSVFTNQKMQKNKPCVIMFFNPECEHCQRETKELMAYKTELKDVQLIMISATSYKMVNEFYHDYNLSYMPSIKIGYDPGYALSMKYQLRTMPSLFVYSSTGKMLKEFVGNVGVPAILEAVNTK